MFFPHTTLNCRGRLLDISHPVVMGILNLTPDSFYDGSRMGSISTALQKAEQMLADGAAVIDIGGMSSRPGASVITAEEELERVMPVLEALVKEFPEALFSIDTVHGKMVRETVAVGVSIVNDISAGRVDPDLYGIVAELKTPYILMHMQGLPHSMQQQPEYEDVVREVLDFFIRETGRLYEAGVLDIVLDPGFGFGKTLEHNYLLLKQFHVFKLLDLPLMAGISRKSMVYRPLGASAAEALNGTSALHMVALQQGARILRAHDVREAVEVIKLWRLLNETGVPDALH